jgi:hypothetical protein
MEPQKRKPRPDLGCSAIGPMDGWMDGYIYIYHLILRNELMKLIIYSI